MQLPSKDAVLVKDELPFGVYSQFPAVAETRSTLIEFVMPSSKARPFALKNNPIPLSSKKCIKKPSVWLSL